MRILVDLPGEMARQQSRLHLKQASDGHAIAEHRKGHVLIEAALTGRDAGALCMGIEIDGRPRPSRNPQRQNKREGKRDLFKGKPSRSKNLE